MLEDNKILQSEIDGVKIGSVQGNRLVGTVQENKNVFDRLALLIAKKFNSLVDTISGFASKDYVDDKLNGVVAGNIDLSGYVKVKTYENIIVPASSWTENTCTEFAEPERRDYPYMAEIFIEDVTPADIGDALPEYTLQTSNYLGNYATMNGKFVVEASEIPIMDIRFEWIKISRRM